MINNSGGAQLSTMADVDSADAGDPGEKKGGPARFWHLSIMFIFFRVEEDYYLGVGDFRERTEMAEFTQL
jgi:hypothetical protein